MVVSYRPVAVLLPKPFSNRSSFSINIYIKHTYNTHTHKRKYKKIYIYLCISSINKEFLLENGFDKSTATVGFTF